MHSNGLKRSMIKDVFRISKHKRVLSPLIGMSGRIRTRQESNKRLIVPRSSLPDTAK